MKISQFAIAIVSARVPYVASQVKRLRTKDHKAKDTGAIVEWGRNDFNHQADAVVERHRARVVPEDNVLPASNAKENEFIKSDAFEHAFSYDYGYSYDYNYTYDDDGFSPSESPPGECGSGCPDGFTGTLPLMNCKGFYYCISGEAMHPLDCPDGTLYSEDMMQCIWKDQVTCTCTNGAPAPPSPVQGCGSGCPSSFTGRLPKIDCGGYYYCLRGQEVSSNDCWAGTKFDSTAGQCIWAHSATCDCVSGNSTNHSSPPPTPSGGEWTMDWGQLRCVSGGNPPHWKTGYPTQQECCKTEASGIPQCMTPPVAVSAIE